MSREEVRDALEMLAEDFRCDWLRAGYHTGYQPFRDQEDAARVLLELEDAAEKYLRRAGFGGEAIREAASRYAAEEVEGWRVDKNPR